VALERARMTQVTNGVVPEPASLPDALVYVTLQELATRVAHANTGKLLDDKAGRRIMSRVAGDENLHYRFYRDLASAALELDPSRMVDAIDRQVRTFAMPGTGIPDFTRHARRIARAGVYDLAAHHDQILVPVVLRHWGIDRLQGLKATAEQARESVLSHIERVGRVAGRLLERRAPQPAL
jgi:acyl-[acyl-carrier-protein] desaturase